MKARSGTVATRTPVGPGIVSLYSLVFVVFIVVVRWAELFVREKDRCRLGVTWIDKVE